MPGTAFPETPHHIPPPPTKENCERLPSSLIKNVVDIDIPVDFADLAIIDISKINTAEGKAQLVQDVRNAMNTIGFFYVINHGYTQEQTRRIFDIAEIPFRVSDDEKQKYVAKMKENGSYQGYKPRQYWVCLSIRISGYPRTAEDEEKTKNVWLKGHTDFGSLTLLWSQPVSALQILDPQGKWKWVKHIDNALVVNAGEALEFLSGRFYKGTIHRVRQPPADQRGLTRLGVFYFALFDDDVKLVPLQESPVLQRVGIIRRTPDDRAPSMGTYRKGRIAAYGQTVLKEGKEKGVEEEEVAGVLIRHYN
ncbi:hypothetical protein C0989_004275 [Termitomyces sp. Mn162]|nr:hypothetical protein C0989_004275 [Termitomyces sp. Mn162]